MKNKPIKFVVISIAFVASLFCGTMSAKAYGIWKSGGFSPVPAYVEASSYLTDKMVEAIHNSCVTWNNGGTGNKVFRSTTRPNISSYPYKNGKNQITKGAMGSRYLMQTYPTVTNLWGNTLTEVDIMINTDEPWGSAGSTANVYDYQGCMTHELGHLLGLDESTVTDAVMYGSAKKGSTIQRTLKTDDKNGLKAIY